MKIYCGFLQGLGVVAVSAVLLIFGPDASAQAPDKTAKPTSACKGLAEAACKAKADCAWIAPKSGKQKPYCRTKTAKKK